MAELDSSTASVAPLWEDDKHAKACVNCNNKFTMTRRKHHCRACGRIFCDTCSNHKDVLPPAFELKGPQRTCDSCHLNLQKAKADEDPSSVPERPDTDKVREEMAATVRELTSDPEDSWVPMVNKRGVVLHAKRIKDSSLVCVRSVVTIDAPLEKTFAIYNDKPIWKEWQPDMLKCSTIEKVDDQREYIYILYKVPVLNNRDICVYSEMMPGTLDNPSQPRTITLMSRSVVHPLCPSVKSCVRAKINIGYTNFEEVEKDGRKQTKITAIYHTDPRGIVPPRIVNSTIGKGAGQVADMADFIKKTDYSTPADVSALLEKLSLQASGSGGAASTTSGSKTVLV